MTIASNGQVIDVTGEPCKDDVVRGGVRVTKSDIELGESEALGGDSRGTLATGSTLSGIEFTIANASEEKVLVDGKWFNSGDAIETIATSWNEEAGAYTAQTADSVLPYGTYTIQETKTNDSYLLTDGAAKTFQIRQDGAMVNAASAGGELEFFDQVVRNDLEIVKMAEDTNASPQVAFKVTNVSTGEAHVVATDENGNVSTASSWNKHSSNTNGNDGLLAADSIKASDMDPKAGVWFSLGEDGTNADVNDGLAALPYGKYTLEELRSDSNEGYDLVKKSFVIERDSTVAKAVWMSLDDKEGPKIQTEETDKADGDKLVTGAEIAISDEVSYEEARARHRVRPPGNFDGCRDRRAHHREERPWRVPGDRGHLHPEEADGAQVVELTFDGTDFGGKKVMAFEKLLGAGVQLASHEDPNDEGQTVSVCEIGTKLTDAADGDQVVVTGKVSLVDTVEYKGLIEGDAYTVHGTIMVKSTGLPLEDADGKPVTATAEFTAEESEGTVDVTFKVDASSLKEGVELVAFEECLSAEGNLVAAHQDIDDAGQTVVVDNPDTPEVPKTPYDKTGATAPDNPIALIAIIGAALVGAGAAALGFSQHRKKDKEDEAESTEEVSE